MKEKTLNNLKKLFEHIPTILTIGSVFIATASFIFNQFYKKNCEKYYGIILDCFKADMYISRWIALFMVLLLIACSFAIYKIANDKSKPAKVFKILAIITESTILFLINLIAFTVIIESNHKNNLVAKMMMAFNKNMVPFIIILAIISVLSTFLIVLSIQHRKTNEFKLVLAIITSIAFLLQICYFLQFLNSYLSPTPENIKNYTVITEVNNDDEEDTNNRYIVVGEYNGDFVCMKISNAYDKKGDKIDLTSDKDLKYSAIEIKKYEFEFISKEDIEVLNSYHFNDVKVIESENS